MKKLLCLAVAAMIVTVFSSVALAQQDTGGGSGPAVRQGDEKQISPEQFAAMKSRILTNIETRRTKLNEAKACVEAATTPLELRKCRPMHEMGPGGPHRGPGKQPPAEQK